MYVVDSFTDSPSLLVRQCRQLIKGQAALGSQITGHVPGFLRSGNRESASILQQNEKRVHRYNICLLKHNDNNVTITPKRRRFDMIKTLSKRCVSWLIADNMEKRTALWAKY